MANEEGYVRSVLESKTTIKVVFKDKGEQYTVTLEDSAAARCIEKEDHLSCDATHCFWTPQRPNIRNGPTAIKLKRAKRV